MTRMSATAFQRVDQRIRPAMRPTRWGPPELSGTDSRAHAALNISLGGTMKLKTLTAVLYACLVSCGGHQDLVDSTPEPTGTVIQAVQPGTLAGFAPGFDMAHDLRFTTPGGVPISIVYASGSDVSGFLGDGHTTTVNTPKGVASGSAPGIVKIASGFQHTVMLLSNGNVVAFGQNMHGELCMGNANNDLLQHTIATGIVDISAGATSTWVKQPSGTWFGCGADSVNQLGDGGLGTTAQFVPVLPPPSGGSWDEILGGISNVLLLKNGTQEVYCMGTKAACGTPSGGVELPPPNDPVQLTPAQVCQFDGTGPFYAAVGNNHSACVGHVFGVNDVWTFGSHNDNGQLGIGTSDHNIHGTAPAYQIPNGAADSLTAGAYDTLVSWRDSLGKGHISSTGANATGQLGTGITIPGSFPLAGQEEHSFRDVGALQTGVITVYAGADGASYYSNAGTVFCVGYNGLGQCGDGTFTSPHFAWVTTGF